ncbi:MAG: radical SAM protein, partial [Thermodesulfobacteriota bacterium]|nr:radical SAM protein [Thermodesulfobacteriota bacterium]
MLLISPPLVKPCEPPAGIARLAGSLQAAGKKCTIVDASIEGLYFLLRNGQPSPEDTWSRRALRHLDENLKGLRDPALYTNFSRYQRAVLDVNRVLEQIGKSYRLTLQLANYQDAMLSPLKSADLLQSADSPQANIFFPYFETRLEELLAKTNPSMVGFSLNYLSQALTTFAMIGFLKNRYPALPVVVGGGLITSWIRNPRWKNPFAALIDHLVAGPGEEQLLALLELQPPAKDHPPDYQELFTNNYLAPGSMLPYAASSGCYWNKCTFCPETAEGNPYAALSSGQVLGDLAQLSDQKKPSLIHFLDNAISPNLMAALTEEPPGVPWYGFARAGRQLADPAFCRRLKQSGCLMLKLGLESGDQGVLDGMEKGIDLALVSKVLTSLKQAGIATYVYLLFGTPAESIVEARKTLSFIADHHEAVTFLNLAIFNMPVCSPEVDQLVLHDFYEGDLSLYSAFVHPRGWSRTKIRQFLDREFKRHLLI